MSAEGQPASLKEKELGNTAYRNRSFDEAITHYTKAFELYEDVTYLNNLAGKCLAALSQRVRGAKETYSRLL